MHRIIAWIRQSPRQAGPVIAATVAALLVGGTALAVTNSGGPVAGTVGCVAGSDMLVHPDGTWSCGDTPTPSPSTLTESPLPSSSPSVSPSPSPTSTSPSPSPSTTTTSPTPSPSTSTGGVVTGCWLAPAVCGYPTPATTGVPAGTTLTAYAGPTTIRSAAVIDGKTVGCLNITGGTVVIRNSRITCSGGVALEIQGSAVVTIEDTEINCVVGTGTGIDRSPSGSFAGRRLYIHECENGLHMETGTSIEDSYIAVRTIGGAHSDGVQGVSGSNIVIRHNTIYNPDRGGTSSVIFAGQTMPGLQVVDNLVSGGTYTFYCPPGGAGVVYTGNRFAGPVGLDAPGIGPDYGFTDGCNRAGITWTNNVRDDTGAAVKAS